MPTTHFFRYLQIRNCLRTQIPQYGSKPNSPTLDSLILIEPHSKGSVSRLYDVLQKGSVSRLYDVLQKGSVSRLYDVLQALIEVSIDTIKRVSL
jgi:hypothetical protein